MPWTPLLHLQATTAIRSGLRVQQGVNYWISFKAVNQFGDGGVATARRATYVDLTPPDPGVAFVGNWDLYQYKEEELWFPDEVPASFHPCACVHLRPGRHCKRL